MASVSAFSLAFVTCSRIGELAGSSPARRERPDGAASAADVAIEGAVDIENRVQDKQGIDVEHRVDGGQGIDVERRVEHEEPVS